MASHYMGTCGFDSRNIRKRIRGKYMHRCIACGRNQSGGGKCNDCSSLLLLDCSSSNFCSKKPANISSGAAREISDPSTANTQSRLDFSISERPSGTSGSYRIRMLELRLMHHYTKYTCRLLPAGDDRRGESAWTEDIPKFAFRSDQVLNALLGISALHLQSLTPDIPVLGIAASHYFGKAISQYQKGLLDIDNNSAEPLLATAMLICHHTWVSLLLAKESDVYLYACFLGFKDLPFVGKKPIPTWGSVTCESLFLQSCHADISHLRSALYSSGIPAEDVLVYSEAIDAIGSLYAAIATKASQFWIQCELATMPLKPAPRFISFVERQEPLAMALVARNFALFEVVEHTCGYMERGILTRQRALLTILIVFCQLTGGGPWNFPPRLLLEILGQK